MAGAQTIVVGAGAAGSVIAARITERSDRSVLLVEAGPDYPDPAALPADLADGGRNSLVEHDWGFRHQPTRDGWSSSFPFPRGKVVGGSSAVNTCIALRGMPYDYDEWAARGLPEWSWEKCLPYFVRLETDRDFGDRPWHGDAGPLPVRRHPVSERAAWAPAFLEACDLLGFPSAPDHNAPDAAGFGPHAMNKVDGRRISAAEAWLTPAVRARENLSIRADTLVRRVVFRGDRAVGVEVERRGEVEVLHAETVVLCAGAVCTPGILLRSGVGPRTDVEGLGVDPVADVPAVGARLLDHPGSAFFLRPRLRAPTSRRDPVIQAALRVPALGDSRPNTMQIQPGACVPMASVDLPLVTVMTEVAKPRGTGRIRFTSVDPRERPWIESDFLEDPVDLDRMIDGLQTAFRLTETKPMRALARHLWPGRRVLSRRDRIEAWIRRATGSGYHPCGTVPMGAEDDPEAATDGRGRVRGVRGLVVADASLMPTVPSSNIHLPTLMIGERFGEWLSADPGP